MADSKLAIPKVLEYEGAYSNDPVDPGGETVFGITRKYEPNWEGWKRVDEIKTSGIGPLVSIISKDTEIARCVFDYYDNLWSSFCLTQVQSQALAECIYNGCINQGAKRVIQWLQYCVNALSVSSEDISEDGAMGVGTINRVSALESLGRGEILLTLLKAQRISAYCQTVHNREDSLKFIKGWLVRIDKGG